MKHVNYLERDQFLEKYIILSWFRTALVGITCVYTHTVCSVVFGTGLCTHYLHSCNLQCIYWYQIIYSVCALISLVV
jgi:hypothetical protein